MKSKPAPQFKVKTAIPIVGFFARYWLILLWFSFCISLMWIKPIFNHLGQFVYFPMYCFGVFVITLLLRHIFHYYTSDEDARNGTYVKEWHALDPKTRTILHTIQFCFYLWVFGNIAAALIK